MSMLLEQLKNIAIVLVRPKYPENIGFVARTALNMGISQLVLVGEERPDMERVMPTATHNARKIIEDIQYTTSLSEALADFHLIVGTTARKGRDRQATVLPRDLAALLAPVLRENRAAIVFGPEDRGLTNEELHLCGFVTSIPTADFTSLNLSHAAAIICQEIFQGTMNMAASGAQVPFTPRLASTREQGNMFGEIAILFQKMDVKGGKEKEMKRLEKVRLLLGRRALQAKETRFISAICREIGTLLER